MSMKSKFPVWAAGRSEQVRRMVSGLIGWSLVLCCSGVAVAWGGGDHHADHDMARRLVQAGAILPLERILEGDHRVRGRTLLDVELEEKNGVHIYEIKVIGPQGRVMEYTFAARDGAFLREKQKQ